MIWIKIIYWYLGWPANTAIWQLWAVSCCWAPPAATTLLIQEKKLLSWIIWLDSGAKFMGRAFILRFPSSKYFRSKQETHHLWCSIQAYWYSRHNRNQGSADSHHISENTPATNRRKISRDPPVARQGLRKEGLQLDWSINFEDDRGSVYPFFYSDDADQLLKSRETISK